MKRIEYFTIGDRSPAHEWLLSQDKPLKLFIQGYIRRFALGGSKKNIKPLGNDIFEIKINRGPGYRVYFAEEGKMLVLILVCGTKKSQKRDILMARKYWRLRNEKA